MTDDPWADWYDAYRRQRDGSDAADAAFQAALKRQIDRMSWFIVGWTAIICSATVFVTWFLLW